MGLTNGSTPFDRYELSDQFHLLKADMKEWRIFYSVYYNPEYIRFFNDLNLPILMNLDPFWIYKGRTKIGGVLFSPNKMKLLYFIPPFNDQRMIVVLLKNALLKWSDITQPIHVFEVLQDQVDLFARSGFWPDEHRYRWMERPIESIMCDWYEDTTVVRSIIDDQDMIVNAKEIGHLFYRCYVDRIQGVNRKPQSISHYISQTQHILSEASEHLLRASTLIYDKRNNALIGACLLSLHQNMPMIQQLGVLPTYRRRGMGSNMIKRSIDILTDQYPILRVYILQGNPVESVYYNLGFMPGPIEIPKMLIPMK